MALVDCGQVIYPDPTRATALLTFSSNSNAQINGSGHRVGWIFQIPRSGTIDRVGWRIGTLTTAVTSRMGLYTVDGSGQPTSTLYGGSNFGTFTPAANTYFEVTLGTSASATIGDWVALVVEFDSTAGDFFISASGTATELGALGYLAKFNGTTWTKGTIAGIPAAHVRYNDASYGDIGGLAITTAASVTNYNLNTAGADEYATRITVPFACRVAGIWHTFNTAATADYEAILYSGTTAQATTAVDGDYAGTTTATTIRRVLFTSPVTLAAGAQVRAAIRPTTTANVAFRRVALFAAGIEAASGMPSGTCESTRVDLGSWTDNTTNLPYIGLILDRLDDGVSAGGTSVFVVEG